MARTWMTDAGTTLAGVMTLDQCWAISETWYEGRLEPDYERPPPERLQALLRSVQLEGDAWSLSPPSTR